MWIDGKRVNAANNEFIDRKSPAHDVPVTRVPAGTAADVDAAVVAARSAFDSGSWPWTSGAERSRILMDVARRLRDSVEEFALLETLESGKPISQARDEVGWTAGLWEYAAALCRHLYGDSCNALGPNVIGMILRDPIGVVGMITPWNFPMLIISQKLPFALAAGCTCVIKPSELTSATTLLLADIVAAAGMPDGVVNVVTGYGDPVGQRIANHEDIDMVSFTGSTKVGKSIVTASAGNLKKVSLELGGKNPLLVFNDADLNAAVDAARLGAFFNMGECCNSSSRILVQHEIADKFIDLLCKHAANLVVGDPLDEKTKIGAIINATQAEKILGYIDAGKNAGAKVRMGGGRKETDKGRFIQTTILDSVTPDMSIAREEIFGPVLSVIRFEEAEEAVYIANGTKYGLSAGVFTNDYNTALQTARRLRAGTVWVNSWLDGHAELCFGGYRQSGLGRELGRTAVEEFTEPKTVQLHTGPRSPWW
jgi:acyl-CoA reductase-like NAD-dependent aldehyde dehydrogenase